VRIDELESPGSYWGGFTYCNATSRGEVHHAVLTRALSAFDHTSPLEITGSRISSASGPAIASADSLWLLDSEINGSSGDGVYVSQGVATVRRSSIEGCGEAAIKLRGSATAMVDSVAIIGCDVGIDAGSGVTTVVANTSIDNCATYGALLKGTTYDIASSQFRGSDIGLVSSAWANGTIAECTFSGNTDGIWIDGSGEYTPVIVSECTIDSSTTDGLYLACGAGDQVTIASNSIKHGTIGIYSDGGQPDIRRANVVQHNTSGITCENYSQAAVESCTVTDNTYGVMVHTGSNPDLGHVTGGSSVGYNVFTPAGSYYVYNRTSNTVSAQRDYWPASPPTLCQPLGTKLYGPVDSDSALCTAPTLSALMFHIPAGEDRGEAGLPTRFSLRQNYPNPFNPTTTIAYDVPRPGADVEISLYDVAGRLVTILVDEQKMPGRYQVHWDGHDRRGQPVASGVYFLRMKAGTFTETKKVLLLR
jgi:Right handed beta helix region/FlgD Ig-like domain